MNSIKVVVTEVEKEIRMVYELRKKGYGEYIDNALAELERDEITEAQYWAYIMGLARKV